ncbi:MAG: hypothetical protein JW832_16115 [Deltaproteobacteria bacterium]|nr:hypothetical protein [Deltaproteobacteria bacterium]
MTKSAIRPSSTMQEAAEKLAEELLASDDDMMPFPGAESFFLARQPREGYLVIGRTVCDGVTCFILQRK